MPPNQNEGEEVVMKKKKQVRDFQILVDAAIAASKAEHELAMQDLEGIRVLQAARREQKARLELAAAEIKASLLDKTTSWVTQYILKHQDLKASGLDLKVFPKTAADVQKAVIEEIIKRSNQAIEKAFLFGADGWETEYQHRIARAICSEKIFREIMLREKKCVWI